MTTNLHFTVSTEPRYFDAADRDLNFQSAMSNANSHNLSYPHMDNLAFGLNEIGNEPILNSVLRYGEFSILFNLLVISLYIHYKYISIRKQ